MGTLSDRTVSRWGRRRPYLLFGSLAMVAGMTLVFLEVGGQGWSQGALFAWVVFAFCLVSTAYTVVFIPYAALTPELARDFQERTNLNGYRMAWAIVGTLLGAGAFTIVVDQAAGAGAGEGYTVAGALFGVISAVVVLITFASVRERPVTRAPRAGRQRVRRLRGGAEGAPVPAGAVSVGAVHDRHRGGHQRRAVLLRAPVRAPGAGQLRLPCPADGGFRGDSRAGYGCRGGSANAPPTTPAW